MDLRELKGGVAVVTGSAGGIGYALAKKAAQLGLHVCLSDVRPDALEAAVARLQQETRDVEVIGVPCDITELSSVEALHAAVKKAFPAKPVQLLGANAGVLYEKSTVLMGTAEEWLLTYKVNVLGLQHTLKTFVPDMLAQNVKSVVEITASAAGVTYGGSGPYGTSKLAALGIAEALHGEIKDRGRRAQQKVAVVALCPMLVNTVLRESSNEVPARQDVDVSAIQGMTARAEDNTSKNMVRFFSEYLRRGMDPDVCAEAVFDHARRGLLYCLVDNELTRDGFSMQLKERVAARYESMTTGRVPIDVEMQLAATAKSKL
eukprot:gnl/TRDRNA2_/TRDRNA2_33148_c0_seq1.p1 gnl/TRDRNA2_/TRDRNA2_33148_c0~~gnl/TRDRNA2_/TRDRNA2_33148_c0_seq1.p1  ORF type:complete len:318 (-),score=73.22 gnl/TRDRNA2_/TRDRNA2_33148_c0_seq1:81-1034(-)